MLGLMLLLGAVGCDSFTETPAPVLKRVDSVKAAPVNPKEIEAFCDVYVAPEAAVPFEAPPLVEGAFAPVAGWRWVNVWATWCGPCVAEMPMLTAWRDRMNREGKAVDLTFVSFDAGAPEVARFRAKHPEYPLDHRVRDLADVPEWLGKVGLDAGVAIPIHLFVDPQDRLRCVRTGALSDDAFATVSRLVGSP